MEDDEQEDVKKMTEFINKQKSTYEKNFQLEFVDFVNFKQDYSDQEFDEDEEESCYEVASIKSCYIDTAPDQELVLTEEEQNIIESCTDPELKNLLILNRSKNMQLIKLHKKMQGFLSECEAEVEEKHNMLKHKETKHLNQQTFAWKLAAPYFKDKKFFPCPLNDDSIRKRYRDELSVYDLIPSPKWTPIEFDRLTNAIKCNYNINRQNDIVSKISALKIKMQNNEDKSIVEEIINLKEQLEGLKNDDNLPPLDSNEFINWYKVAETFLKDKHTAAECQSVWHMLLHPEINKSEWTEEENKSLEAIAKQHLFQNWDDIATELNTNRTGFTTCLHYYSKLCDKFKRTKFTQEEDRFLLEVVDIYKVGNFIPWNKVVCHFNNRSRHQLYHRYTYFLSQNHVKRGKFSEAEDILLIILVNKFGRNFKKCAEYMPDRSQVQLKSRYNSNLQRHIKKGTFSSEEDEIIYNYAQKFGEKSWTSLATKLKRCNAQIRQRYKLIKTFLQENPQATVTDIPKRRHRFDEMNEGQHDFLNYMAEQYKDAEEVPTLLTIEESLQAELVSPNPTISFQRKTKSPLFESLEIKPKNIDAMLTDIFVGSVKMEQCGLITEAYLNEATENAKQILKLLDVKLDIPKDLESDNYIDNTDVEILERISKNGNDLNQVELNRLIPPNLNTLVALRCLIIKHKEYKSQQRGKPVASTSKCDLVFAQTDQKDVKAQELEQNEILFHKELFSQRFDTLFNWSALLSLEKPNQLSMPEQVSTDNKLSITLGKAYSKRPLPENNSVSKKRKIDVSALTDLSKNPQLKLVDKQVVENLIKQRNISVIKLDCMSGSNIMSVIKPVSYSIHSTSAPSVSTSADDSTRSNHSSLDDSENVTSDDLQDVETLNTLLKTMKSEGDTGPSCKNEEYQVIKNDVQLLNQILQYEKIRVKSDPDGPP